MTVTVHDDIHFASIAYSLTNFDFENNPVKTNSPQKVADFLKKENIRSYNFAHNKRLRITSCVTVNRIDLDLSNLMRAVLTYQEQASIRDDFKRSEAGKFIHAFHYEMPKISSGYEQADITGMTIADVLKSFAVHDDGDGMRAWHWDNEFGVFEESGIVHPGRLKPWPWIISTMHEGKRLPYREAQEKDAIQNVKFLLEHDGFPNTPEASRVVDALLRHHILRIPELDGLPPYIIALSEV